MRHSIRIFGYVLFAALLDAAAFAGSTPDVDRAGAGELEEIYSNFNSDEGDLYDCCQVWDVSTAKSDFHARYTLAMGFKPAREAIASRIQLALSSVSGNNALSISLHADDGGMPGKALQTFQVIDIPPEGDCCEVEAIGPMHTLLRKGRIYWVVAKANADTEAGWNFNSIAAAGLFAFNTGDGWQIRDLPLGAFRVLGE